jgi:hypothetical protein
VRIALIVLMLAVPVLAQEKPDPRVRVFALSQKDAYVAMVRAISAKWDVTHSEEAACLVRFEKAKSLTSSGFTATATCQPDPTGGTSVMVKARQGGEMSFGAFERRFSREVLDAVEKSLTRE